MRDAEMITEAVARGMTTQRTKWLTTGRGLFVTCCTGIVALAAVATAAHTWVA